MNRQTPVIETNRLSIGYPLKGGKRKVTPLIETKRGIGYMIREPKN